MDGLSKCLTDEFSSVYVFNLRGNQRTSGETSRKEGGNIPWKTLHPDDSHDWINQRDPAFDAFLPLGDKSNSDEATLFDLYS